MSKMSSRTPSNACSDADFSDVGYDEDDDVYGIDCTDDMDEEEEEEPVECLTPEDLISTQLEAIKEVNSVFQIPAPTARILLQHFGWDKELLLERYYGDYYGSREALYAEAHIVDPSVVVMHLLNASSTYTCEICYMDCLGNEMAGLPCGHMYCKACWNQYLSTKVLVEGAGSQILCPEQKCTILVDEYTATTLIKGDEALRKYRYFTAKAFVQGNKHIKWCPAPGCENAVRVSLVEPKTVTCKCGQAFCFGCGQKDHVPVLCATVTRWQKKCADDSETCNWIQANTKECPKCRSVIEKNGGCNHMTCKNLSCRYDFCWVCLGEWGPHGSSWYSCNRFDEKETQDARASQDQSRHALKRYLHYYNRFSNHEHSTHLEGTLLEKASQKMEALQKKGMSWIEVQFLTKAVAELKASRQILKWTYVFGYFLQKSNQGIIFEDNQKDLENATEALSHYLENDKMDGDPAELKQKVMDKTHYCESRRKVLVEHVQRGYEDNYWNLED